MTSNVHLVQTADKVVMIDTGDPTELESIEETIKDLGLKVDFAIVTHGHVDHAGNGKYFREQYGIEIMGGRGDQSLFKEGTNGKICPTSGSARIVQALATESYDVFEPDIYVESELDLSEMGVKGNVTPMQGHTEVFLVIQIEDVLFVGDVLRGEPSGNTDPSIHFFQCDLAHNRRNISKLVSSYDCETWFTGNMGSVKKDAVVTLHKGQ